MKRCLLGATAALAMIGATAASAGTLDDVKARGELICIVNTGLPGFRLPTKAGKWQGFDVDHCRAVAAAIFGDANKVKYKPATGKTRFTILNSGEGDVIFRNTTWTFVRDVDVKLAFQGTNYYDGQGFMVPQEAWRQKREGTRRRLGLHSDRHDDRVEPRGLLPHQQDQVRAGPDRVQRRSADELSRRTLRRLHDGRIGPRGNARDLQGSENHVILPEIISKEPLGPATRHGDDQWSDIIRWTTNALIAAEELGVTQKNVDDVGAAKPTDNPEINRLLGTEGNLGGMLGLEKDWAAKAIKAVGNYGEIFDRNIGPKTPIGLERGLNALWTDGGLQYTPPFR